MSSIQIESAGCITALGNSPAEIWERLTDNENDILNNKMSSLLNCKYVFETDIDKLTRRKSDRFCLMGLSVVEGAKKNSQRSFEGRTHRVGTIFSSSYSSLSTNIKFAEQVISSQPEICSPTVFSNTVSNAVLGYICIKHNFTGVSTMLLSSSDIHYSSKLIDEGKADCIFSGSIEEYNKDLFDALHTYEHLKGVDFSECAVVLLLTSGLKKENEKRFLSKIINIGEINLHINPYMCRANKREHQYLIKRCIEKTMEGVESKNIKYVFGLNQLLPISTSERCVMKEILPESTRISGIESVFGESMSTSSSLKTLVASLCLANSCIPQKLSLNGIKYHLDSDDLILVNSVGSSGNFTSIILSK